jgi:alpha-beta hydrolase superfamily lysophospholipase
MSPRKELLQVPVRTPASAGEIYSGIARMAGTLWCARHRATPGRNAEIAVVVVHPSSNFLGHYALDAWADRGVDAVAMTTRYIGNDSTLLLENCVLDVGSVVAHLREVERYEKVVLVGNSGGGGLAALYQEQAEHPSITSAPCGGGPDLTAAELPPLDALVLLMAHPGRANLLVEWLDPAVRDPLGADPFDRDPELDLFEHTPPYDAEWVDRYRAAQAARGEAITSWVEHRLSEVEKQSDGRASDLPFVVQATCADPRFLDLSLDPSDRETGTLWGDVYAANLMPSTLGHLTSLRSWLSQWSLRTSRGNGPDRLTRVTAPVHVIYGTGDQGCFPSHARALHDAVRHDRKRLTAIHGGKHYLNGQTELTAQMAEILVDWVHEVL